MYGYNGDDPGGGQVLQPSLAHAIRAFTSGAIGPEDFHAVFTTCKVFCPRGERPGFLALHDTPQPVIPMFSSLVELRRYSGEQSRFFTVTGAEVLDLLPTGYGIVESDGRRCRMLHYGALKVAAKRQKECAGAALQDVHARVCGLMRSFPQTPWPSRAFSSR